MLRLIQLKYNNNKDYESEIPLFNAFVANSIRFSSIVNATFRSSQSLYWRYYL